MANCLTCGCYYRTSIYHNDNKYCEDCFNDKYDYNTEMDDESKIEIELLLHPSGKNEPKYLED